MHCVTISIKTTQGATMPLYEYQCQECSQRVELIQKFSDPPLTECPSCRGPLEKLLFAAGIHFKGSGFYINDYARKGKDAPKEDGTDSKKDDSKKSESVTTKKDASGSSKDGGSSKESSSSASTTSSTSSTIKSESKQKSSK